MPTRDYDPINDIIEAIGATRIWPITKVTTDAKGNITIGPGSADDYITTKTSSISTRNPEPAFTTKKEPVDPFAIRSVLSNRRKNAFSVVWEDGTTTVVHCQPGDEWDDEKALAMCFTKKALGNKGNFNDKFNDALDNKMKVIKSEKEVIKEEADIWKETLRSPDNGQLELDVAPESTLGLNKKIANDLTEATHKADTSMKKMVDALIGGTTKTKNYRVFVQSGNSLTPAGNYTSANGARDRAREIAKELFGRVPYYYRMWTQDGKLYIDFGSYTKYVVIDGMTIDEWNKG